jgi:hypothetical protein
MRIESYKSRFKLSWFASAFGNESLVVVIVGSVDDHAFADLPASPG